MFGIQGLQFWHCLVVLAILAYVWISVESVAANENAVVTFGGKPTNVITSGYHFVPAALYSVIRYSTERQRVSFFVPVLTKHFGEEDDRSDSNIGIHADVEVIIEFNYPTATNGDLMVTASEISNTDEAELIKKFKPAIGDLVQDVCGKKDWKELKRVYKDIGTNIKLAFDEENEDENVLKKADLQAIKFLVLEVKVNQDLINSLDVIETTKNKSTAEAISTVKQAEANAKARKLEAAARRLENAARLGMDPAKPDEVDISPEQALAAEQLRVGQGLAEGDNNWVVSAPELTGFIGALSGVAVSPKSAVSHADSPPSSNSNSDPNPSPAPDGDGENSPAPDPVPDDESEDNNGW